MLIAAQDTIDAERADVFSFLADLRNHWLLTGRWVRMLHLTGPGLDHLGPTGGWVELRGPMGISRRLKTTVVQRAEPSHIDGIAELGARTRARITWVLEPCGPGRTHLRLEARIEALSAANRLLLALGARRWLAARFAQTLAQLALLLGEHGPNRAEAILEALGSGVLENPLAL